MGKRHLDKIRMMLAVTPIQVLAKWEGDKAMASPGNLVRIIAASTGRDVGTVSIHDRNLAVAGLRSMSGRGLSAASVTYLDASRLLTALLGSLLVKESVTTVRAYEAIQLERSGIWKPLALPQLDRLPPDHSFIDALAALIEAAGDGSLLGKLAPYPFQALIVTVQHPNAYAKISVSFEDRRGRRRLIEAQYMPALPDLEDRPMSASEFAELLAIAQARTAAQPIVRTQMSCWSHPILYAGALIAGTLDQLPDVGNAGTIEAVRALQMTSTELRDQQRERSKHRLRRNHHQ